MATPSAFDVVVKLLSGREKSAAKLRQALEKKGFSIAEIDEAITRAQRVGYFDEAKAAKLHAERALREGKAPERVEQALATSGYSESVAATAVARAIAELSYDVEAQAKAVLAKSKKKGVAAARFLASRGFDEALITKLVDLPDPTDLG